MKVSLRVVVADGRGCARIVDRRAATSSARAISSIRVSPSYKNARYEQAIEHFKNAVALDPSLHERQAVSGGGIRRAVHSGGGLA